MARLFVDVDGTLVNWGKGEQPINPFEEAWEFNQHVIRYVNDWLDAHPEGELIIWSGGGSDYAWTWGERAFGRRMRHSSVKVPMTGYLEDGDLFIDDSPWKEWAHLCIHPDQLLASSPVESPE